MDEPGNVVIEDDSAKLIVRTSDRQTFRKCRQLWNFTSKVREDWEYLPGIEPLDFGIAVHKGLEIYYDPRRWNDDRFVVEQESLLAFGQVLQEWKQRLKDSEQWDLYKSRHEELVELGIGMLNHYFSYAPKENKIDGWEPLKSEIEFELPIPVPDNFRLPPGFTCIDGNLYKIEVLDEAHGGQATLPIPIVYQGRADLIVRNIYTGKVIVVDFKTAAQFTDTEHWNTDTQISSYLWAIMRMLGINVEQFVIEELRKKVPHEPNVLKNGTFSKAKNQSTTLELYEKAIKRKGFNRAEYEEILDHLKDNQQEYFRRIPVDRSPKELENVGRIICMEAIDMFSDPYIYPHANRWNCSGCAFYSPCQMKLEGSDEQGYMKHSVMYSKRQKNASNA